MSAEDFRQRVETTFYKKANARQVVEDIVRMSQKKKGSRQPKGKPRLGKLVSGYNSYDREGEGSRR